MSASNPHISVMVEEVLKAFEGKKIRVFFEGTVGAGGHALEILKAHPEIKKYLACDQDKDALKIAKEKLKDFKEKLEFIHGNYVHLKDHLKGNPYIDGFFLTWGCPLCS